MAMLIPMEQKGVKRMLVNRFLTLDFNARYNKQHEFLEFYIDNRAVSISGNKYIHELRNWLDDLDDEINRRRVLNTNGDHEAPEDIYGAGRISDSVE